MSRRAALWLTPDLFIEFLKVSQGISPRRFAVRENALPDDAKVVWVLGDGGGIGRDIALIIESETFADVPVGETLPSLPSPIYEIVYDDVQYPESVV